MVVTVLLSVIAFPIKWMPAKVFVLVGPLKVVVPEPEDCKKEAAVNDWIVTFAAPVTVRMPMRVPLPTAPWKRISPVPLVKVKG